MIYWELDGALIRQENDEWDQPEVYCGHDRWKEFPHLAELRQNGRKISEEEFLKLKKEDDELRESEMEHAG